MASGRNQSTHLGENHRCCSAQWCELAHFATLEANNIVPPLELNLVENIWEFLRANYLSHRVWDNYDVPSSMRAKAHGTSSC